MATSKSPLDPSSNQFNPDSPTGRFPTRSPRPNLLSEIGKQVGPISQTPVQVAENAPVLQITPQIAASFRQRLKNADTDEALIKIVVDAAKYGVDWSHMLTGMK